MTEVSYGRIQFEWISAFWKIWQELSTKQAISAFIFTKLWLTYGLYPVWSQKDKAVQDR